MMALLWMYTTIPTRITINNVARRIPAMYNDDFEARLGREDGLRWSLDVSTAVL